MVAEQIAARIAGLQLDQIRPSGQPQAKRRTEDDSRHITLDKVSQTQDCHEVDHADENPLTRRFYYVMQQRQQHERLSSSTSLTPSSASTKRLPPKLMNVTKPNKAPPSLPPRPTPSTVRDVPPPIPPRIPSHSCLWCRDFSAVDAHAAMLPRENVRSLNDLAHSLTSPFSSVTDKARAIYTWLHHNIAYNTEDFFRGTVKAATPEQTLKSGLAVCEGYAGLFADLAGKSGVNAKVVSGYGKGYGYVRPAGSTLPKFQSNHAWNAVKLDNREWHLIDPCWGAGHIGPGSTAYIKKFNPFFFCSPVDEFGQSHFPSNPDSQFLNPPRSWAEFIGIPESPIISRHVAGLYIPIQHATPPVKAISRGCTEFRLQLACSKVDMDCPIVLMSPSGQVTEMTRHADGWRCTVDVETGRWMCGIPTETDDDTHIVLSLKDYRSGYVVRGICIWECVA